MITKWEYKALWFKLEPDASPLPTLNKEGEQGWEIIAVNIIDESVTFTFKRQKVAT